MEAFSGVEKAGPGVKDAVAYRALKLLLILCAIYAVAKLASGLLSWAFFDWLAMSPQPSSKDRNIQFTVGFVLFFLPWLYLGACLLAGRVISIEIRKLAIYMGAVFLFAQMAEAGINTAARAMLGRPLWIYRIWPACNGCISHSGALMWPLYGFFMYLLHRALEVNPGLARFNNNRCKALLVGIDAMTLEILANAFSLMFFRSYFFYYYRGDLNHFTTIEIFVPYVLMGALAMAVLDSCMKWKKHGLYIGAGMYALGLVNLKYFY